MKNYKKYIYLLIIAASMLLNGCHKNNSDSVQNINEDKSQITITQEVKEPDCSPTPLIKENVDWSITQKDKILSKNPKYKTYTEYSFSLKDAYIALYITPDSNTDFMNFHGDIWAYGKDWVTQVEEDAYISPNTYGINTLNDLEYFRYDRSYVTDSFTVLLMLDDKKQLRQVPLSGALNDVKEDELTVFESSYDLVYLKSDNYTCGHTWKPYYYYLDDYDLKEYEAHKIEKEDFLKYQGAQDILDQITLKYENTDKQLTFKFLERDNGLIHINIMLESLEDISYYYETYQIVKQGLKSIASGEGNYRGPSLTINEIQESLISMHGEMDDEKLVYFLGYSEEDNSITIQNIEWLTPWADKDKARIQELLDANEIPSGDNVWEVEYYIYTKQDDIETYKLSNDVKIILRTGRQTWEDDDKTNLKDVKDRLIVSISIKDNLVYLIYEIYTP